MSDAFHRVLEQAGEEMRQARAWLLQPTPESLDRCHTTFERAAGAMRELQIHLADHPSPAHLPAAIACFRRDLRRNQTLLACAGSLRFGARQAEIAVAGLYDRQFRPALPAAPHRVSITA